MVLRDGNQKGIQLISLIKIFHDSHWTELVARWVLGGTFVYASYNKLMAPADFAKIIYGYDLFPAAMINLIAIHVPFLELVAGTALIIGCYPRSAALIVNAMLLVFISALSINLIRGHEFDCGCFSINANTQMRFAGPLIFRDFVIFVLGLHVVFFRNRRKLCIVD